ncbi:MAG TPA: sugar-binding domain-containing protein [Actinomycetales bacterium]|nr:sugar-binding domain-containing protein [Actinomycetales bacterium]
MSTPETAQGPAELVLTASVARRYYIDGRSKVEIAQEFRLSRFKVARLLDSARATGLVRIDIGYPGSIDVGLSGRLQEELGLQHAIVVDTVDEHPASLRSQVGRAAAELLSEIVAADDVLGLGWARSLMAMRGSLTSLAPCSVVQLTGALSRPDVDDSSIELVRDVARIAGGPASYFYAPMIVPDATTAAALRRQPELARAMERFASVTKAVVGVGGWDPPASTVHDALSPAERKALRRLGVLADVSGVFLDEEGTAVEAPLTQRIIGIRAAQLHRVPEVIAIAYGPEKAPATRAAIRGGYVTGLVTHSSFARALLPNG